MADLDGDGGLDLALSTLHGSYPAGMALVFGETDRPIRKGQIAAHTLVDRALPARRPLSLSEATISGRVLAARIELPSAEEAALQCYDLAGRRFARERLVSTAVGARRVTLTLPGSLANGVYWLVLRQGMERATTRIAIVR